jgi:hypothetical protein
LEERTPVIESKSRSQRLLLSRRLISKGFKHLGCIGVLDETNDFISANDPVMRKRRSDRPPGAAMRADISAETDHFVTFTHELLGIDGKAASIATKRFEQTFNNCFRPAPCSAIIGKAFSLGPFYVGVEQSQDRRHVAASKRTIEAADGVERRGHFLTPLGIGDVK